MKKDPSTVLLLTFPPGAKDGDTVANGTVFSDGSSQSNDGILFSTGGATYVKTNNVTGIKLGQNDYILVEHSDSLNLQTHITIEVFLNVTNSNCHFAVLKGGAYGSPRFISDNLVRATFWSNGGSNPPLQAEFTTDFVNKAALYSSSFDGGTATMYINGIKKASNIHVPAGTSKNLTRNKNPLWIGYAGGYSPGKIQFEGVIYGVRITTTVLDCVAIQMTNCKSK